MVRHPPHFLELARRGAELQFRDLVQEIRYLIDLFPHLRDSFNDVDLPVRMIIDGAAGRASKARAEGPSRRRRSLSDAAAKAVGARTKKNWPARREAKKG